MSASKASNKVRKSASHASYARYRTLRRHRRRLGFAWAILAAIALLSAWDLAGRMDEVAYTVSSVR
jgi:hypothetical protein